MDCSLAVSVHGNFQARVLEGVAISFPGDLPDPGIEPRSPALQADSLLSEPPGKTHMYKHTVLNLKECRCSVQEVESFSAWLWV